MIHRMDLSRLLEMPPTPLEAQRLVQQYYEFCCEAAGFVDDETQRVESPVAGGIALSPADAARCILDLNRTLRFLAGIDEALRELHARFPDETLRVLYAGCGPFATLGLPFFGRARQHWTCVDVHESSIAHLQRLLHSTGLASDHIELRAMDAAQLDDGTFHLIVAEVMQRALEKEPQLSLTARLAPRLREGGIFVPESIQLHAAAADVGREVAPIDPETGEAPPRRRVELGTILDLRVDTAQELLASAGTADHIDLGEATVPPLDRPMNAAIRTTIQVHGDQVLDDYDSGLTVPLFLDRLTGGEGLHWRYRLGLQPGPELVVSRESAD